MVARLTLSPTTTPERVTRLNEKHEELRRAVGQGPVQDPPYARYTNVLGTPIPGGTVFPLPYPTIDDVHPLVVQSADYKTYTLGLAGVWLIVANSRAGAAGTADVQHYLCVFDPNGGAVDRWGEANSWPGTTTAGASLNVAVTRRFGAGESISVGYFCGSSGSPATSLNTDVPEANSITLTWLRS